MTELLFDVSSPVFEVDGEVRGELARDLLRLEVEESCDGLKHLSAQFVAIGPLPGSDEEGLMYLDGRILDFGKPLLVAIGPLAEQRDIFDGRISAIEFSYADGEYPQVCIRAEDRLMDLRMTRRMHSYEEMSDADMAADIAERHGLAAQVDADGPSYDLIQQWNMSDLAFLRERARLLQAEVWVEGDTLHFTTRERRDGPNLTLTRGREIIRVQARADLAEQRSSIQVSGYDAFDRSSIDESAGADAVQAEIPGGRSGPVVLEQAFGERISHRVREVPLNATEAADWARAEMLRRARRFVCVQAETNGTPGLTVGSVLDLQGMGGPFDGDGYYVTRVRHNFDSSVGHRTRFDAERATIGGVS